MKKASFKDTRLYVPDALSAGAHVTLSRTQTHYILHVMRLKTGDFVCLFNGRDGEWHATIAMNISREVEVMVNELLRPQRAKPDLWLCCAPIKRAYFDYMIMKATELGVAHIQPVLTSRTQVREVNIDRCHAISIEAAEQSERLTLPDIRQAVTLDSLVQNWPQDRLPVICAEIGEARSVYKALQSIDAKKGQKAAIITGPEGGFAPEELEKLRRLPHALPIRLGPRILRADTAALAALACWQAICGKWKDF